MSRHLALLLLVFLAIGGPGSGSGSGWDGFARLDPHTLLWWSPQENGLVFKIEARTTGYVGFGFTRSRTGLAGADVVLGWVDSKNKGHLLDGHISSTRSADLIEDSAQNYKLLWSYQNASHTLVKFSRAWDTCDPAHDVILKNGTMRVVWTTRDSDPGSGPSRWRSLQWSGPTGLHIAVPPKPVLDLEGPHWDVRAEAVSVSPSTGTLLWCRIYKAPLDKQHHVIGFSPLVEPGHEGLVRHMILYECLGRNKFEIYEGHEGAECYSSTMPKDWIACATPTVVWMSGSRGEMFPGELGLPIAEGEGKASFFMLEIHYDNPARQKVVDHSGLRLLLSEELRAHDGAVMVAGLTPSPLQLLPPGQSSFTSRAFCDNQCTNLMLPDSGIHVVSVLFHTHGAGRRTRLRHIREGVELQLISQDEDYDPSYQQARRLSSPVKVMPGDQLLPECTYSTQDRPGLTLGGRSGSEETCQVYLTYYPRTALASCTSSTPLPFFFQAFGIYQFYKYDFTTIEEILNKGSNIQIEKVPPPPVQSLVFRMSENGLKIDPSHPSMAVAHPHPSHHSHHPLFSNLLIYRPEEFQNKSLMDHLASLHWNDPDVAASVYKTLATSQVATFCRLQDNSLAMPSVVYKFPNLTQPTQDSLNRSSNCQGRYLLNSAALYPQPFGLLALAYYVITRH